MFVHKPTFSTLDLTEDRITETIITCRLKKFFKPSIYRLYKAPCVIQNDLDKK